MKKILIAILVGLAFFLVSFTFLKLEYSMILGIVAFLVTLWTNEGLPLGVVSILPIILFPLFGILDTNSVTANYSKSIIFLFLGGFMLAIAIEKTDLHRYFSSKLLSFAPETALGVIYSLAITSAILSSFLSNTTTTLMLMSVVLFLSNNNKLTVRFLLATAYGSSIGGVLTPIGTPPNFILLGFLEEHNLPTLSFGEWIFMTLPVVISMLIIIPYLLSLGVQNESVKNIDREVKVLNKTQKRLYAIIGILAITLILNTFAKQLFNISINEKLLLLSFGILMFMPKIGFLEWEDTKKIPYEIIFLFGAGFSIANAFSSSGLALEIALSLHKIEALPFVWIIFIISLFVIFSTEVTSNTALTSIAIPIFYELTKNMPTNEGNLILLVATISASYAFMLPIATPPNAIVMSSNKIHISEMAKVGFKLNIIGAIVLTLIAYFIW